MANLHEITVGIDLGGTSLRIGLFDSAMRLIASHTMPTRVQAGPQACVEDMAGALRQLLRDLAPGEQPAPILGIGIGSPGPINLRTGVLGLLPNLPGWDNFPLRDALAAATALPVVLESDANAAALAEWQLGAGQDTGLDAMAMLTLGTGVGSGLIFGGRIWHGMFGMGGEVGHATVDADGSLCGCGTRGCLEMYASAKGLLRLAEAAAKGPQGTSALRALVRQPQGFTAKEVADLATRERDAAACAAFERLGHYLGIGVANLINVLDLPLIVIGGGGATAWNLFAPTMFRTIREYSVVYRLVGPTQLDALEVDRTFIRPAALGASAGLMGAGLLPRLALGQRLPGHDAGKTQLHIPAAQELAQ